VPQDKTSWATQAFEPDDCGVVVLSYER
jgi:hypothetical protein